MQGLGRTGGLGRGALIFDWSGYERIGVDWSGLGKGRGLLPGVNMQGLGRTGVAWAGVGVGDFCKDWLA